MHLLQVVIELRLVKSKTRVEQRAHVLRRTIHIRHARRASSRRENRLRVRFSLFSRACKHDEHDLVRKARAKHSSGIAPAAAGHERARADVTRRIQHCQKYTIDLFTTPALETLISTLWTEPDFV